MTMAELTPTNKRNETEICMQNVDLSDSRKESLHNDQETISFSQGKDRESDSNISDGGGFFFCRLSQQKKTILISVFLSDFLAYVCFALMAPFFPEEASSKNVDNTISGWIFGVFAGTQVILFPIFGKIVILKPISSSTSPTRRRSTMTMLPKIGLKTMYVFGVSMSGSSTLLFGLTTYIPTDEGPESFITLCFLLRIAMAMGCAAINTASATLIIDEFPENMTTVFGVVELFIGMGCMAGPAVGGFLYGMGGFVTPFSVIGGVILLSVPIFVCLLQNDKYSIQNKTEDTSANMFRLLQSANVVLICLTVVVAAIVYSVLEPTLEPHLRKFKLGSELIGLIFLLSAALYSISSPIWGCLADKVSENRMLTIPGLCISTIGLLLLGPSTLLGFSYGYNELWLNIIAICIVSFFTTAALIPTYESLCLITKELGFTDGIHTYSMVAGLWQSMYSLGDLIGPAVGGWLLDEVGFQWETTFVAGVCLLMAFSLSVKLMIEHCSTKSKNSKRGYIPMKSIPSEGRIEINGLYV